MKKNRNFFVHIGFGKNSTTFLQNYFYPLLCKKKRIKYFLQSEICDLLNIKYDKYKSSHIHP